MARILQLTDPHLAMMPVSGRLDTVSLLRAAVSRILEQLPKIAPVDALLVTGDISDDGSPESYAAFREIVAPLDLPLLVLPGNHDLREPFRAAFADLGYLPGSGLLDWTVDLRNLRVIGLDTLVEGQGGGVMRAESLEHLSAGLEEAKGPVIVALHHPPFDCGIRFMDAIGLKGRDAMADCLSRHDGPIRIVCGHVHTKIVAGIGGHMAIAAPSPCSTFDADFRPDAPVGFLTEPGGLVLHDWTEDGFRSVLIGQGRGSGPHPF